VKTRTAATILAFAVLLAGGSAEAQERRTGVHTHDGFFLQMDLGLGGMSSTVEDGGSELDLSGGAGQFSIGIGGALTPNFILAGQLWGVSVPDPDVELDGESFGQADATLGLSGIGVQLVYYFMPLNLYVSATPSITQLSIDDGDNDAESEVGLGVKLAVGKEWWVSDNWALGLNAQLAFSSNDDSDLAGAPEWSSAWFGVAFSATFN
jgi:hypothetical protein